MPPPAMNSIPSKSTSPSATSTGASAVAKRRRKALSGADAHSRPILDSPPPRNLSPTAVAAVAVVSGSAATTGASSAFRNVSACNRCRLRKNRCDQRLPACLSCEKAGVRCVGYDPITKREIPRSYVHYLETRLAYLESLLMANNIPFSPADDFPDLPPIQTTVSSVLSVPPITTSPRVPSPPAISPATIDTTLRVQGESGHLSSLRVKRESSEGLEGKKLDNLVSDIGLVSFAGASDPRYLGSVSGISFARVVFSAVKSSTHGGPGEQNGTDAQKGRHRRVGRGARGGGTIPMVSVPKEDPEAEIDPDTQMRDSFFGLHTKPTISPAPFPARPVAERLVHLYFEHANPQIPSLHRGEFTKVLDIIYAPAQDGTNVPAGELQGVGLGGSAREHYLLNIVCAIGAGIFMSGTDEKEVENDKDEAQMHDGPRKKQKVESKGHNENPKQADPESYHASAMLHLEEFLHQSKGGLEELQAVLLLAGYALLRPVSPGLWYIVGVAVRLAVDLGLHYEDADIEGKKPPNTGPKTEKEGKKEWLRDMRRRLWWCVYNLDRLVSTCVGRPFGIADEVISTQFPSMLDDQYIHPTKGLMQPPAGESPQSYKLITHHYTRLRLLQSEILQVLQQQSHAFSFASASSESAFRKDMYKGKQNYPPHHPYHLQTLYLQNHGSLQAWHKDMDRRLKDWMDSAPTSKAETGVEFSLEFIELNYWQTKIMLYRPCLSVPVPLGTGSVGPQSRTAEMGLVQEMAEDEERVYMAVAEAGSKVLRIYRQLHRVHQVNYTFLATHHLFMAGISFLYAIWHSPYVRSQLSMDEVDFTILAATSVLGDLVEKCPPAAACRDAFERMSRATVQMCLGGGSRAPASAASPSSTYTNAPTRQTVQKGEQTIKTEDNKISGHQYSAAYHAAKSSQTIVHLSPTQQHMMQPNSVCHSHSIDSYSQHAQMSAEARRRQPVHFDDGFQELFTSPRHPQNTPSTYGPVQRQNSYVQSPTTPTEGPQYHPSVYTQTHHQRAYPQSHGDSMMIDPALQQRTNLNSPYTPATPGDWGHIDMSQYGIPDAEMWEHDSWSEEGNPGQVDLFDGFFFGGGN